MLHADLQHVTVFNKGESCGTQGLKFHGLADSDQSRYNVIPSKQGTISAPVCQSGIPRPRCSWTCEYDVSRTYFDYVQYRMFKLYEKTDST